MRAEDIRKEIDVLFYNEGSTIKEQYIIGIDGMCCSGKTTLAQELAEEYNCNVFHMDDFFLRPEQRTQERLSEVGGNVDYERFLEEVIKPLKTGKTFTYRPFDCFSMQLMEPVRVIPKRWNIIEGAYSLHPYLGDIYDYRFFMDVEEALQKARIIKRNGKERYERFISEWIPKENAYFKTFQIDAVNENCRQK